MWSRRGLAFACYEDVLAVAVLQVGLRYGIFHAVPVIRKIGEDTTGLQLCSCAQPSMECSLLGATEAFFPDSGVSSPTSSNFIPSPTHPPEIYMHSAYQPDYRQARLQCCSYRSPLYGTHNTLLRIIYRPGRLAVINGTMNSTVLKENVRPSVRDPKLKRTWILQQNNDPKHTSKSTSEWLKKNKVKTLKWPSQSPDLNPVEMLWHDLKKVVHVRKPSSVAELQQFCKDEWPKIPPQCCE
ncbi:hypothetical protein NFI96_002555 [Prochilodus magdalenae]|nr:hypothetical protein NFI96_002555 [Prochilodus magdalenae]